MIANVNFALSFSSRSFLQCHYRVPMWLYIYLAIDQSPLYWISNGTLSTWAFPRTHRTLLNRCYCWQPHPAGNLRFCQSSWSSCRPLWWRTPPPWVQMESHVESPAPNGQWVLIGWKSVFDFILTLLSVHWAQLLWNISHVPSFRPSIVCHWALTQSTVV